jgi:hypothetical protein
MHIRNKFEKFLVTLAALSSTAIIVMIFKIQQDKQALSDLASSQTPDPQTQVDAQPDLQQADAAAFPIDNTASQPATDSGIFGQSATTGASNTVPTPIPTSKPTTVQPTKPKTTTTTSKSSASTSTTSSSSSSTSNSSSNKKTSSSHH